MITKKILFACPLFFVPAHLLAQTSLQDQINAVNSVQEMQAAEENNRIEQERIKQQQSALRAQKIAEKKQAQLASENAAKHAETLQDKKRDQSYEDELRQLEIEERKLELAAKKAKVNRANDYIDQELKSQAAQTDVVQSQADAARNVSKGTEDLMRSTGRAKEVAAKEGVITPSVTNIEHSTTSTIPLSGD